MESGTARSSQAIPGSGQGEPRGWRLFHVVTSANPPAEDFQSQLAQGMPPRFDLDNMETYRRAAGVSCFRTADQARALARRAPSLGSFIAEVFIPDDSCAI